MIKNLIVENFKCIEKEKFEFRNLTVLTGENSSGKSSIIQAILFAGNFYNKLAVNDDLRNYLRLFGGSNGLFNKFSNAKQFNILVESVKSEKIDIKVLKDKDGFEGKYDQNNFLSYPDNLLYLNADRERVKQTNLLVEDFKDRFLGIDGRFTANYLFLNKNETIEDYLIKDESNYTLGAQVDYWLKKITDIEIEFKTDKTTPSQLKGYYNVKGFEFSPENVGIGVSYLISILVACLSAKKGNIIIIENPEIHLHPKSQAALGEFLAFVASKGIQIIIETHNDHIINKICYEEFKNNVKSKELIIYYKKDQFTPFEKIEVKKGQFYSEKNGNRFPEGFFDATLKEIFEING